MNLRVLLVDDDKMAVFLQKIIILESNFTNEVITLPGAAKTLDYLDENAGSGDAFFIFLDINMPIMNGWELLDAIKKRDYASRVYVAMVSSYSAITDQQACKNYPQIQFVFEKPITPEACNKIMKLPVLAPFFYAMQ